MIIDHKSFPGSEDVALTRAAGYAGQLSAYAEAVSAALGRPVESMWIHLPILGKVIRVQEGSSISGDPQGSGPENAL